MGIYREKEKGEEYETHSQTPTQVSLDSNQHKVSRGMKWIISM